MGILDIFRRGPRDAKPAPTLNGYMPTYSQFGQNIFASDVVQQALKCIVDEIKKLKPTHIRNKGADPVPVDGKLQDILNEPNALMTQSEFLEKVTWLLLLNYNAFIVPSYYFWTDNEGEEHRQYVALYPIQPSEVEFVEDVTGAMYVTFWFANGYKTTLDYRDVIHLRYNYGVNEFMGGNMNGQPDTAALLETVKLNHDVLQGVARAMKASYAINGVVKYNSVMDAGKTEKALRELESKLANNESGFLPIDLKAEFTPLEHKAGSVDAATLKFIDDKILRNWGIPLPILTGDYTSAQYEAFFQKVLEPLIISYSQAFTKKLFTSREKSFGNEIKFLPKDLVFLSMTQTLEMINILAPTGALYENEKRVALGLRPLPELEGKRYMSLNWIDANNAAQYQTGGNVNVDIVDEEKQTI